VVRGLLFNFSETQKTKSIKVKKAGNYSWGE